MDSLIVPTTPEPHLLSHASLPTVEHLRASASCSTSQIASILRQLPPPPKYDIAVTSVDAPPPLYTDIGKDLGPFGFRTTPSGARPVGIHRSFQNQHHLTTPTVQPLNIQYLYPPKYEKLRKKKLTRCVSSYYRQEPDF
ncbi:Protein CBG13959 [Caenorhabditis briggsae]|uniref:Protein CBG13959 n=1 Tax=Caenorhabditis briggsae TaxID=6238 RepID=A8XIY3_CAEBR|nr:Protein CBG13959 [Caenorhabditis briggsae]CAP32608.2 Protein CBG13959 [Caenorhabditis briggsae]